MYSCTEGDRVPQISGGRGGLASESMQTIRPHAVCHDKPLSYGPERLRLIKRVVIFEEQLHKGFGSSGDIGLNLMVFAKQTKRKAVIPSISKQYSFCKEIDF